METVDNALVEGAILWLAQTILANLLLDKLDAWLHHVGLADETERLMSEVERVEMVVAAVKGRANGNRPLTRSLARLKELMYDADDMVDELDYYRLQHQVQGGMFASADEQEGTDGGGDGAEQVDGSRANPDIPSSSSTGKRRSKAWAHFEEIAHGRAKCKYCGTELQCETTKGTSVLHNHLKSNSCRTKRAEIEQTLILSSAIDGAQNGAMSSTHASDSRKRKRIDEVSAVAPNTPANSHPWNKAKFCDRIQQMTHELHQVISDVQKLYGSAPVASSNICRDTIADPSRRTSSLIQCKMYGRHAEKNSILKLITEGTSDGVLVVPILGIGGIGKTALAQSVYNDPTVKGQFVHRIWTWVSNNFDEVRLTMEMLDFVSQGMHAGISSLAKLQEILSSHVTSNKTLLILDDVWDDIDDCRWNKLLAPFRSDNMEGNVILVTTRKLSVAKRIGTVKQIELCGMQSDDFWLLFKTCSFGDETYQEQPSLNIIGQQIAEKLHYNPLAAETAGMLLRQHLTTDHWSNILKNEKWKCLQLNGGIMASLKLSYDNLPENLQQCFRYCCLFPKEKFLDGVELVRMWISQGYVQGNKTGKKLEDMGKAYLADLVNSGLFAKHQYANCFGMPDLMYDLARELSGADFATIDDKECKKILPTTRHLSIVTESYYETFSDENLKKNLLQVTSVRRLRSLVIIGDYDLSFFTFFLNMFREAENLRLLQICATFADFDCFINNLVSCTHIRYIQAHFSDSEDEDGVLPQALTNFFHLQVLDLGLDASITLPSGMSNLVSMQHLVAAKEIHSTIACIGKMTALQELPVFKVRNASEFDIRQLQSMDQLVQLNIYQLKNVKSKQEAGEARLTDKGNLEELCLSWESWEFDSESYNSESLDSDSSNLGISRETTSEVLEGLKPHQNVKHLQIYGYSGSVFPSWLSIELKSLQLLHLENCTELRGLPPVEKLPFLRKLKLINIYHIPEIVIPCLEELELNELPSLKKCVATCRKELDFYLQVLTIKNCGELMVFPPFETQSLCFSQVEQRSWKSNLEGCSEPPFAEAEQKQWLSGLRELTLHGCPHLMLSHPLPPAPATEISIRGLSTHPAIEKGSDYLSVKSSNELRVLDAKILAFQYLKELTSLHVADCPNLMAFSFEGFRELLNLKFLEIIRCGTLVLPSCNMPTNAVSGDWKGTNCPAFPRLRHLRIKSCGAIAGKWLTEMLPHMQSLEELDTEDCPQIKSISIHHRRQDSASASLASTLRCEAVVPTRVTQDEFLFHIPLNVLSTLKILCIRRFPTAELSGSTEGFGRFTSLTKLDIADCPMLLSSADERSSPFIRKRRYSLPPFLKELLVGGQDLQYLWLHSCMALDMLNISNCRQLAELEDLQELSSLRVLSIELHPGGVEEGNHGTFQLPPIEKVSIKYLRDETAPYLLGYLQCISKLDVLDSPGLVSFQLGSVTALKELKIQRCGSLESLQGFLPCLSKLEVLDSPGLVSFQLSSLTALKELTIQRCGSLESLQGFLPELEVFFCDSKKLTSLQLGSPTGLKHWTAYSCKWLASLESLQSLENLAKLRIFCSSIPPELPRQVEGFDIFPRLEKLLINDVSTLTISFCKHLTSLRHLDVYEDSNVVHFTDEQEKALQLLTSLQSLEFCFCHNLVRLPDVLHSLHSLKRLEIFCCRGMSRLPDKGLPQSLEELVICQCSAELNEECRMLATERLRVKIDCLFVN